MNAMWHPAVTQSDRARAAHDRSGTTGDGRCDKVYLDGKSNLTIRGEDRESVTVDYPNNARSDPLAHANDRYPVLAVRNC